MRPKLSKLLHWLAWIAASAALLFAVAATAFYFFFPSERIARLVSARASAALGSNVEIGRIAPFPLGRLFIGPLRLSPDGDPFVSVQSIDVRYDPAALLRGKLRGIRILIDHPSVALVQKGAKWNFERFLERMPPSEPKPNLFAAIDFQNTPIDQIWPKVQKILQEKWNDLPDFEIQKLEIRNFERSIHGERMEIAIPIVEGEIRLTKMPGSQGGHAVFRTPEASRLTARARDLHGMDVSLAASAEASIEADWPGNATASISVAGVLKDLDVRAGELRRTYDPFTMRFQARADLSRGEMDIESAHVRLPGFLEGSFLLHIKRFGLEPFQARGELRIPPRTSIDPLTKFLLSLPKGPSKLPTVNASLDATGRLKARTFKELRSQITSLAFPMELRLNASLEAKDLPKALVPAEYEVRDIRARASCDVNEHNARAESSVRVSPLGLSAYAKGWISSVLPFPQLAAQLRSAKLPVKVFRENVTHDLSLGFSVSPGSTKGLSAGLTVSGSLKGSLRLEKSRTDRADLKADFSADRFFASKKGVFDVRNLSLRLPVDKRIWLGPSARHGPSPHRAQVWKQSFLQDLEPISPYTNALRIQRIDSPPYVLEHVRVDAGFDGSNFVVNRFAADLLGGSVWGRFTLIPMGDTVDLAASLEAVDLDAAKLSREPFTGDSRVSADAQAGLKIRSDRNLSAEGILDELEGRFHLTRLGDQALDRLLAYMDPQGEDPSFVRVRGLLHDKFVASALKNPQVAFQVSHGILDADIALPGVKFVNAAIPIRGVSVKNLLKLGGVRKSMEGLAPALKAAKYLLLAGFDDDGKVVFFQESSGKDTAK
ncbi:MAG: hypothetical protein V1798_01215 [Pseudomonadota bacterium]